MNKFFLIIVSSFLIASCSSSKDKSNTTASQTASTTTEQKADADTNKTAKDANKSQPNGVFINDNNGLSRNQPQIVPSNSAENELIPLSTEEEAIQIQVEAEKNTDQNKKKKGQ